MQYIDLQYLLSLKIITEKKTCLIVGPRCSGKSSIIHDIVSEIPHEKRSSVHIFEYSHEQKYNGLVPENHIYPVMYDATYYQRVFSQLINARDASSTIVIDDCLYDMPFFHATQLRRIVQSSNLILSMCYPFDLHVSIQKYLSYIILLPKLLPSYVQKLYSAYLHFMPFEQFENLIAFATANNLAIIVELQTTELGSLPKLYLYDSQFYRQAKKAVRIIWNQYRNWVTKRRYLAAVAIQAHVLRWLYSPVIGPMYRKVASRYQSSLQAEKEQSFI